MRVLIVWSSKRGGTAGIARLLAEALVERGVHAIEVAVEEAPEPVGFDAVVIGAAVYANRWPAEARHFIEHHLAQLRQVPVWLFSSGPLDDSAEHAEIPPPPEVAILAERVGALGHTTFGGRLTPDATGFPAAAMAKTMAGDWRSPAQIAAFASALAERLPTARPRPPIEHPAASPARLIAYAGLGWALSAALLIGLVEAANATLAWAVHAAVAPLVFVALARGYFAARGARSPFIAAATFTAIVAALDLMVLALATDGALERLSHVLVAGLAFGLVFVATYATGRIMLATPGHGPGAKPT